MEENYDGFNTGFPGGNLERWSYAITSYLPQAWTTLMKTVDPLIYASLVELLGSNTHFDKTNGDIKPIVDGDNNITGMQTLLQYSVPDFVGYAGSPEAIAKDQNYILQKCQAIPNIQWTEKSVHIDVEHGAVKVMFILPLL